MPRRSRTVFAGVPHHVTQRGNNHQSVFFSSGDFRRYADLLVRYADHYGVRLLGYCLMSNHVHLIAVPETESSLARALGRAHSEYALALNRAGGRSGHVWQNRFFSCAMDGRHVLQAMRYVDLNPVRAGVVRDAWDWPWSSARAHVLEAGDDAVLRPDWSGFLGGWDRREWQEMLQGEEQEDWEAVRRATRTGEPFGDRTFLADLERRAGKTLRVRQRGRPKAVRQVSEECVGQGDLF